jgi:hypothetical protein
MTETTPPHFRPHQPVAKKGKSGGLLKIIIIDVFGIFFIVEEVCAGLLLFHVLLRTLLVDSEGTREKRMIRKYKQTWMSCMHIETKNSLQVPSTFPCSALIPLLLYHWLEIKT